MIKTLKLIYMDFNLPEPINNNYTQTLSNPLPTQVSIDQLTKQTSIKSPEVVSDESFTGITNDAILPEPTVVERKKKKDEEK